MGSSNRTLSTDTQDKLQETVLDFYELFIVSLTSRKQFVDPTGSLIGRSRLNNRLPLHHVHLSIRCLISTSTNSKATA